MIRKKLKKIAVLACYFGELPWYFEYFKGSCSYNTSIDFILVTDQKINPRAIPENLIVIHSTLDGIGNLASEKLGIDVKLESAYKLCDLKPAYGVVFAEFLKAYDFWAHADIDIIFGNIRRFITDDILRNNDLICVRHDYLTGYFLLFRNNKKMNYLFTESKDYKKVLTDPRHYCFDETNFAFTQFAAGIPLDKIDSEIESMMHVVKKLEHTGAIRTYFDFIVIEGLPGKLKWVKGELFFKNKFDVLLYHLVKFKKIYNPKKRIKAMPLSFSISPKRIYNLKS